MRRVAVQDANILIDLELAGLFDLWLQTGIETHTTGLIESQLRRGRHTVALAYIASGAIRAHRLSADDLEAVAARLAVCGPGPDLADCSVLWLAEKIGAMLLTGDSALRKVAETVPIETHGTIWILDRLVKTKLLPASLAASKIEYLLSQDRRLPKNICDNRIRAWRKRP